MIHCDFERFNYMDILSRSLNDHELSVILQAANPYYKSCMIISLATGLRISDLLLLEKTLSIPRFSIIEQKTGKSKRIYLPEWSLSSWVYLVNLSVPGKYLFSVRDKSSYRKTIKRLAISNNLDPVGVCWHSLRKTVANQISKYYGPGNASSFLNHSNLSTTKAYIDPDLNSMDLCFNFIKGLIV